MTSDEMKELLLSTQKEGADVAAIFDNVVSKYAENIKNYNEAKSNIDMLTSKVADLSNTNLKLVERIKYQTGGEPENDDDEVTDFPTVDDLFSEV